jgi:hypothetical protein
LNVRFEEGDGNTSAYPKTNDHHVRLVRGGQSFDALAPLGNGVPSPSVLEIPTLSRWTLILLALLMAGMAAITLRLRV